MNTAYGTLRSGRVELDAPVDWPEGERVTILRATEEWGLNEADWPDTPERLAALIASMSEFEPLEMTPAEEAEWKAAREAVGEFTLQAVRKQMGLDR